MRSIDVKNLLIKIFNCRIIECYNTVMNIVHLVSHVQSTFHTSSMKLSNLC